MTEPQAKLDQLLVHVEYMRTGIDQINDRLDAQNGRVRTVETAVAVLNTQVDLAKETGQKWGAGTGAAAGGFVGGLLLALHSFLGGSK